MINDEVGTVYSVVTYLLASYSIYILLFDYEPHELEFAFLAFLAWSIIGGLVMIVRELSWGCDIQ